MLRCAVARPPSPFPVRCLDRHPSRRSVIFAGCAISLTALANTFRPPLELSYLSRIFSGHQLPSLAYARLMADGLGMGLQSFIDELDKGPNPKLADPPRDVNPPRKGIPPTEQLPVGG